MKKRLAALLVLQIVGCTGEKKIDLPAKSSETLTKGEDLRKPSQDASKGPDQGLQQAQNRGASTASEVSIESGHREVLTETVQETTLVGETLSSTNLEPSKGSVKPHSALAEGQRLSGTVESARKSQLAFRVGGVMKAGSVKPGDVLKKGDPLASLDDRDFNLRLQLSKVRLGQAQVAYKMAEQDFKRESELKDVNASTVTAFEKIQAAFDQARLNLKLAELDLEQSEWALKDSKLLSPYDAVVVSQFKHENESVPAGVTVYEVYDISNQEVLFDVPERLFDQVMVGTAMSLVIPSANYQGEGKILRKVPVVNEKTRSFQIAVSLPDGSKKVAPGLFVEGLLKKPK